MQISRFHNFIQAPRCADSRLIANGVCNDENNNIMCYYDGGDCCGSNDRTSRVFQGI